uniref:Uncharacterized protein n=1 Tax=Solanum lycopersicum TaxID=4081 RepID=A0A3Q7JB41_SOLLC
NNMEVVVMEKVMASCSIHSLTKKAPCILL